MLEFKYPYTDTSVLNLDWFLEQFKLLVEEWRSTEEQWAVMQQNFETLERTVQTFTTFVENYFENLDVQQEINNKLDQMALDGTLSTLLAPLVDDKLPSVVDDKLGAVVTDQLPGVVTDQLPGVVEDQIGAAVAPGIPDAVTDWLEDNVNPVGSAVTIDSSLSISGSAADAAVVGERINHISAFGSNLFDPLTVTDDKRLDAYGGLNTAVGYFTSDFIPVTPGYYYYKNSPSEDAYHRMCLYKSNQTYLADATYENNFVLIPDEAAYLRICGELTEKSSTLVAICTAKDFEIRNVVSDIGNYVEDISYADFNGFNSADATDDVRITSDGSIIAAEGSYVSDFIDVLPGITVYKNSPAEDAYHRINVYDWNKTLIAGPYNNNELTIPADGYYVRFCGYMTEKSTASLTIKSAKDQIAQSLIKNYKGDLQASSMVGYPGFRDHSDLLSGGVGITLSDFPYWLKKNVMLSFYGKFSEFSSLLFGKGYNTYRGDWVYITATEIQFYHYESVSTLVETFNHGLTLSDYLMVMLYLDENGKLNCYLNTKTGTYSCYIETDYNVFSGAPFAIPGSAMTDVDISASAADIRKPLWIIGDSYCGLNQDRVIGQLKDLGYWSGILVDSLAGMDTNDGYFELMRLLEIGKPKYLIWYLGMNGSYANYSTNTAKVIAYCEHFGITLILNKVPSVPDLAHEDISTFVDNSGLRYIDSYRAVGSSVGGNWYFGYLSSDNVHPTVLGAEALAMEMIVDVPEIAEYGF